MLSPKHKPWLIAAVTLAVSYSSVTPCMAQNTLILGQEKKSDYAVLIAPDASPAIKQAAMDLREYFRKVAGVELPLVTTEPAPNQPFISLGATAAAKAAGIGTANLPVDAYRTVVKGRNLFILGHDTPAGQFTYHAPSIGTSNGVYGFCEEILGVRWLMPGEIGEEYKPLTTVSVPITLDHTEAPQLVARRLPYLQENKSATVAWSRRMKLHDNMNLAYDHNWDRVIPASLYEQHPDWFAEIGGKRLPPVGRYKLETTNPELIQEYANRAIKAFRENPKLGSFSLSPTDGGFWSESAASRALYDTDPKGRVSMSKLVLTFYNEVAKIVGKEFPDRKVAGYIYEAYIYPPSTGVPPLEPNLTLMLASSISYGYKLHRPEVEQDWEQLVDAWGKATTKNDLYYYDLPIYFKQSTGTIMPPSPEILETVFSRISKDKKFKGIYIYGNPTWSGAGVGNYALAKLIWNPALKPRDLCREYYQLAYHEGATHIEKLYDLVDAGYKEYYIKYPLAGPDLTPGFLKEIYGPRYAQMDALYAQALAAAQSPKAKARLEFLGHSLSLLQWNLREHKVLPADFKSDLTRTDEQIDAYFAEFPSNQVDVAPIATTLTPKLDAVNVTTAPTLPNAQTPVPAPLRGDTRILLCPTANNISVTVKTLDTKGEFARFTYRDAKGQPLKTGALRAGRTLNLPATPGQINYLEIASVWSDHQLEIKGASYAFKANAQARGLRFNLPALPEQPLPLWFYVPEGVRTFTVTINGPNALADVIAPDGQTAGQIDTRTQGVSRVKVEDTGANRSGFWQLRVHNTKAPKLDWAFLVLDPQLPQWVGGDLTQPLKISQ